MKKKRKEKKRKENFNISNNRKEMTPENVNVMKLDEIMQSTESTIENKY